MKIPTGWILMGWFIGLVAAYLLIKHVTNTPSVTPAITTSKVVATPQTITTPVTPTPTITATLKYSQVYQGAGQYQFRKYDAAGNVIANSGAIISSEPFFNTLLAQGWVVTNYTK